MDTANSGEFPPHICSDAQWVAGNFTRVHRVSFARAVADATVDQVLESFSRHKEFNKAFDEATYALDLNTLEPSVVVKLTHTALRQTADLQYMMVTQAIVRDLKIPIVPFNWLRKFVSDGVGDLGCDHVLKLRDWIKSVVTNKQLLSHDTSADGPRRLIPYVSSPADGNGNVANPASSMLRVNHANPNSTMTNAIAGNMLKHMTNFFGSSNIDREVKNLIPALDRHSIKMCDFEPLFNMQPVLNVNFFLGLLFTVEEMRQLDVYDIFIPALDDKPTTGHFTQLQAAAQGNLPWTAYGIHIVVGIILASFLGDDTPDTPACTSHVASKITSELLKHAPVTMLHPSGSQLLLRGFTGKTVRSCTLEVEPRTDRVQASFFHRPRNDTSLMNSNPSISMLDSPMQPYMFEDVVHTRWVPFLLKSHLTLVQEWDQSCVVHGTNVGSRGVRANSVIGIISISDMYRSLDPVKIPCNDTLLYGVYYPIVGAGMQFTQMPPDASGCGVGWDSATGWVCLRDAQHAEIHVFKTDARYGDEEMCGGVEDEDGDSDGSSQRWSRARVPNAQLRDRGCAEQHHTLCTKDVFQQLRAMGMLVQPVVNRPGAVVYHFEQRCFGLLDFNLETGRCYNQVDGCYTMRLPTNRRGVPAAIDDIESGEVKITPLQLEGMLLGVPTKVLVNTQAFIVNGMPIRCLPHGAVRDAYLKCNVWYPSDETGYTEGRVYLLAHTGGFNSSSYTMLSCDVSWLVADDAKDDLWTVHYSVNNCD